MNAKHHLEEDFEETDDLKDPEVPEMGEEDADETGLGDAEAKPDKESEEEE